jgi:U4/U6 small nuclear ribonucleoprotein PRP31
MSTLVDELLQDWEDSGSEGGEDRKDAGLLDGDEEADGLMGTNGDVEMDVGDLLSSDEDNDEDMGGTEPKIKLDDDPEEAALRVDKMKMGAIADIRSVAGLLKTLEPVLEVSSFRFRGPYGPFHRDETFTSLCLSNRPDSLPDVLQKIAYFQSQHADLNAVQGNTEDHPEYHLLTQSNTLSTSIDSEIVLVHKWIRDHYSVRFPELETLIGNPLDYARAVAILGNGPLDSETMKRMPHATTNPLGISLESVLDRPTLMIVTTSAITSKGQPLQQAELDRIVIGCEMIIKLDKAKRTLTDYVQSRMNIFAPNLTALIGSLTAAQLLNAAGGLTGLAKTPACNISAWGSKKGAGAGALATNVGVRQQGYLFQSPLVRSIPSDLKTKAMRIVSAKLVLAARVDRIHQSPDGQMGEDLRDQCLERLDKLQEKPLNKGQRALPVPDDKPARKRGGRRARKAKEAVAMTDLRKAQNRMAFGKEEKEVGYGAGDGTKGLGMIGVAGDGRVRGLQIDQRTRAKLSAKSKGWGGASTLGGGAASSLRGFGQPSAGEIQLRGKGLRASGVGTTVGSATGGTVSSLAFTPVQGLELVDPSVRAGLEKKRKADEDKYFKSGTFTQLGGGGDGVFKKPDLPAAKRVDTGATKAGK